MVTSHVGIDIFDANIFSPVKKMRRKETIPRSIQTRNADGCRIAKYNKLNAISIHDNHTLVSEIQNKVFISRLMSIGIVCIGNTTCL